MGLPEGECAADLQCAVATPVRTTQVRQNVQTIKLHQHSRVPNVAHPQLARFYPTRRLVELRFDVVRPGYARRKQFPAKKAPQRA